ncbi:MAG: SPASM domain-containing protein [Rhodobacter sp.]|nr:SPASM domain-containing protein [Rhodobacter sp.]
MNVLVNNRFPAVDVGALALSGYVHRHQVAEGVIALYHPFGHEIAFIPEELAEPLDARRFEQLPPEILNDLIQRSFLVPEDFDRTALDQVSVPPIKGFFSLWLLMVQTCNMACRYCVVEADKQTRKVAQDPEKTQAGTRMTPETADRAIEVFRDNLERNRQPFAKTTIYGGEPLLNRLTVAHVVPRLRQMRWEGQTQPLEILCFTNGLIYDPKITDIFAENDVTVGLSLDGLKSHNDASRPLLNGGGSFDKIVASLKRYKEAGVRVGLSCTIGKHNKDDLAEIAAFFADELGVNAFQLQTPIDVPGNRNPLYVQMGEAAKPAWEAFKAMRARGGEEGLAMRRLVPFMTGRFHHRDCAAVGGELVVSPDGTLGPCHNATIGGEQYFNGNVTDPKCNPEVQSNFIEWHARMPVNMPGCHGCSFIGLCGGGCPYNALINKGSIWEKDPQQCYYMKNYVDLLLEDCWERYVESRHSAQAGGLGL